ncbi:SMI1/KNR4 family protein [Andreprevotia chitinilytica]|uniref:SMI1/KNR4 family protein n=1 Tax=Andreprevotia chitinilytica TaxID=396808 RepID=UPI000A0784E1|nr:SMI1/KNR4 family protein [Andreprevotia chitinilytica]
MKQNSNLKPIEQYFEYVCSIAGEGDDFLTSKGGVRVTEDFEEIDRILEEHADFVDSSGEKPLSLIDEAQRYLGVVFPPSYVEFLMRWGTLDFGPNEYYGVIDQDFDNSGVPDAVWFTMTERVGRGFPPHLIVVRNIDGDEYHCLDTTNYDADGECPVVVWDCPSHGVSRKKADRFSQYLLQDLKDFI